MDNFISQPFQNKEELDRYLKTKKNSYTDFILKKQATGYAENSRLDKIFEKHHIQPTYMGGFNYSSNIIELSYEDHTLAHQLLFECYGNRYDKAVWKMRSGLTSEARREISIANVEKARIERTGRFSSELQRELGSRSKKPRKPFAKNAFIVSALQKVMVWVHADGSKYTIEGYDMESPFQVATFLSDKCSEEMRNAFKLKGSQSYLYTGVVKILTGWRDVNTNKTIFSVGPWRLEGILL